MKYKFLFFICLFICTILSLTSCSWAGGDKKEYASNFLNDTGRLVSKKPIDFDEKFGYQVMVYKLSEDSSTVIYKKVFIPANTWKKLPEPDSRLAVNIEYIKDIEQGELPNNRVFPITLFWDFQFNLCTRYDIDTLIKN